ARTTTASGACHSARRARSSRAAASSCSTKVRCDAPRERASRPSAPLPANRSSARAPWVRAPSQLKSVSRTRSGVGRMAAEAGKRSFLPRHAPPMMRSVRARLPDLLADTAPCLAPAAPCHFSRPKRTLARLVQKHSNTTGPDRPAPHSGCALERSVRSFRDMKKLIAAGVVLVAMLAVGCTGGNGVIGSSNLDLLNGNPGGSTQVRQPSSNTALFHPGAGILPYPTDLYFAGSTDGTLNIQPAN